MVVRIFAAIAAIVFAALLAWTLVISFGPEAVVMPEVGVTAEGEARTGSAEAILQARTKLQEWRAVSGPSPGGDVAGSPLAAQPRLVMGPGAANARGKIRDWLDPGEDAQEVLRPASEKISGSSSLPYRNSDVLVQPEGRDWRRLHNDQVRYGGGWVIFGAALALALFLLARGRIRIREGWSGETIPRFNAVERANHWMTATSFLLMGLTGLVLLYGKPLLLPVTGADAFGAMARGSAWLHMAAAVPFTLGLLVMIVLWTMQNIPDRYDAEWLKRFGGFLNESAENPPARKFNAGQKIVFWGVVLGGLVLLASGAVLMYPFLWLGYGGMQWTQLIHAVVSLLMVALILGHIYIGTVGMEGAFDAMWSGRVDRNWAKEHHSIWYARLAGRGAPVGTADEEVSNSGHGRAQAAE